MNKPPNAAQDNEAALQAKARQQRLAAAFADVFGLERQRSLAQKSVIEHLAVCASDESNSYRFNEAGDGIAMIAAGIHRDGARSMLRIIERQLSIAANAAKPEKAKPTTRR